MNNLIDSEWSNYTFFYKYGTSVIWILAIDRIEEFDEINVKASRTP